jgi:hypothetical protein
MKNKKRLKKEIITPGLQKIIKAFQNLQNMALLEYSPLVDEIIQRQSHNKKEIEHLLDGILDFCFDDKMLFLFKKLCRYFYTLDPVATAEYVLAYREMWEDDIS